MFRIQKSLGVITPLVLLMSVAAKPILAADNTQFDGKWNAEAYTTEGECTDKYSFTFKVKKGMVKGRIKGNKGSYKLAGPIEADGTTELGLNKFEAGKFVGAFEGEQAEGTWETKKCNGTFAFSKKP